MAVRVIFYVLAAGATLLLHVAAQCDDVQVCTLGTYCDVGGGSSQANCVPCSAGRYSRRTDQAVAAVQSPVSFI